MAANLTVVKTAKPREPMPTIELDMNDLKTREMVFNHIRHQTLDASVNLFREKGDPVSLLASVPMEILRDKLHEKAWTRTFEMYPQMSDKFNYVIDTENLTISEAGKRSKNNGDEPNPA